MPLLRKITSLLILCLLANGSMAQPRPMTEGQHYTPLTPALATQANTDTIEILDVFWYGCPLCREFEPMMSYYGVEIRGDLVLRRMPAIWNPLMKLQAQVYYTAVELMLADTAHPAAFHYVQEQQLPLSNEAQAQAFFSTLGVSPEKFSSAWQSDNVSKAVAQAEQDTQEAGISQLPALLVNGRYQVVRNEHVKELPEVIIITNQLIRKLRDERRID